MNLLRFFRVRGFYNPFSVIYFSLRVLTRFFLGRQRRDSIFRKLHWENLSNFLERTRLPEHLIESFMIEEVERRVKRKGFRHEPAVSSFLENKKGSLFIDIGANIGYYSFLLHNNFDMILAVEPHPKNIGIIEGVKEKYGYNKVTSLSVAVSNRDGKAKLYFGRHCGGHSLLNVFPYSPQEHRHTIRKLKSTFFTVQAVTLNTLLQTIESVDLVKVDVEGAEWKVLGGANEVMQKIKSWLIELHDLTRKTELEDLMKSFDYKVKWVDFRHLYAWKMP